MQVEGDRTFVLVSKPTEEQLLRWISIVVPQLRSKVVKAQRRKQRIWKLLSPLIAAYMLYGLFSHASLEAGYFVQTPVLARLLLGVGAIYFLFRCYITWHSWRLDRDVARLTLAESALMPGRFRESTITLSPSGLAYRDRYRTFTFNWETIAEIEEREGLLIFMLDSGDTIYLPLEIVEPDQLQELLGCVDTWVDADTNLNKIAVEHMRTRRLSCWKCAYELRGVMQAKCPECGLELDLRDLAKAQIIAH